MKYKKERRKSLIASLMSVSFVVIALMSSVYVFSLEAQAPQLNTNISDTGTSHIEKFPSVKSIEYATYNIYDVPLEEDLQIHINSLCAEYGVPESLVYSVIYNESTYNQNAISYTGTSYGLMQIHECNFDKYNITNPFNPYENTCAGISMLSEYINKYEDIHRVLMAYNCGEYGAKSLWNKGITTSSYSKEVIRDSEELSIDYRIYEIIE